MKMFFDVNGIKAHFARSGEEALAEVQAGVHPDVVISDYQLPGDNGVETILKIRKITRSSFPAILITGDTSAQQILAQKPQDFTVLHKPVDPLQLLARIVAEISRNAFGAAEKAWHCPLARCLTRQP